MSYDFTKGKYRAFIRTTYLDESGTSQTVDGEPEVFDSEAVSYFTFKTNSNIKLDPETLEVPNAEETSSGTYKGLSYSLYDNGLVVISGTQNEEIAPTDESPWYENTEYIYAKCNVLGGYTFKNNSVKELQAGYIGFVPDTNYTPIGLFAGPVYLLIDITNLDTSNTNTLAWLFKDVVTEDINGLETLNVHSGIETAQNMMSGLCITGTKLLSLSFDTSNFPDSSAGVAMFGFTGPNVHAMITVNGYWNTMFSGISRNDNPLYELDVTLINSHVASNTGIQVLTGTKAKILKIESYDTTGFTNAICAFYNAKYLERLIICSDSGFAATPLESVGSMFENCSNLKRITDEHGNNYQFDTSAFTYGDRMFLNCPKLEQLPWRSSNQVFTNLYSAVQMFKNCFTQTDSVWPYCEMVLAKNMVGGFENAFEGSGFKGVVITFTNSRFSNFPKFYESFKNSEVEAVDIVMETAQANTGYNSNAEYFTSACEGCTKLKYFRYLGASNLAVYITGTLSRMFYGCSNLEEVELAYLRLAGNNDVDSTDMFTGCSKLDEFVTPSGSKNFAIDLPKTMYAGGIAYTVATLKNTKYDATP